MIKHFKIRADGVAHFKGVHLHAVSPPHPPSHREAPLPCSHVMFPSVESAGAVLEAAEGILGSLAPRGLEGSFQSS